MTEAPDGDARPRGGRRVRWRQTAGFIFSEATYPAGGRARRHEHQLVGLAVVLEGGFQKRMHRTDHACIPGSLTLEPAGVSHAESYGDTDVRALLVEILPERLAVITDRMPSLLLTVCASHPGARYLGERVVRELRRPDAVSPLALEGLALELLAAAGRGLAAQTEGSESTAPAWLRRVTARLRDEFRSVHTLSTLAIDAGVHPTHLARVFRAREGCSVGEFVRRLRVEWAAVQLTTTSIPLSSLAHSAGFYDQSHFTRAFTARMGTSPGRYRALAARIG